MGNGSDQFITQEWVDGFLVLDEETASQMCESGWWKGKSPEEITKFQLFTQRLCMPSSVFHTAVGEALGRPVFTHEFAHAKSLQQEFLGERKAPTFEEVMALIPESKLIVVKV